MSIRVENVQRCKLHGVKPRRTAAGTFSLSRMTAPMFLCSATTLKQSASICGESFVKDVSVRRLLGRCVKAYTDQIVCSKVQVVCIM